MILSLYHIYIYIYISREVKTAVLWEQYIWLKFLASHLFDYNNAVQANNVHQINSVKVLSGRLLRLLKTDFQEEKFNIASFF
jgi:hypothetical protein